MKHSFIKLSRISVYERFEGLDWSVIATELDKWNEGQRGYIEIKKEGKIKSPEQLGYYYAVILPEAFKAFKESGEIDMQIHVKGKVVILPMTKEAVDMFLKFNYGGYCGEYKDKGEMDMAECSAFEDWCILWLGKWLNVHIPPADKEWRKKSHG